MYEERGGFIEFKPVCDTFVIDDECEKENELRAYLKMHRICEFLRDL